jgi:uncharacterized protein (DUF2141 family)
MNFNLHPHKLTCAVAALLMTLSSPHQTAQAADLIVNVVNLSIKTGTMSAGLFDVPKEFPQGKKTSGQDVKVQNGKAQFLFKGLTTSKRYAVAIYHDENDNGEFDKAFLGFPLEAFGFSRDASVLAGAPSFEDSNVELKNDKMEITIKLKHSVFD